MRNNSEDRPGRILTIKNVAYELIYKYGSDAGTILFRLKSTSLSFEQIMQAIFDAEQDKDKKIKYALQYKTKYDSYEEAVKAIQEVFETDTWLDMEVEKVKE